MPTVLLVDDSEVSREAARAVLERSGFSTYAADPSEGIEQILSSLEPDVVLLDVGMTSTDVTALCRAMKKRVPGARIALFSALSESQLATIARESGADGQFSKLTGFEHLPAWLGSFLAAD